MAIVFALLWALLERNSLGRAFTAVGQAPAAAFDFGIIPSHTRFQAFVIGGMLAGVSGAFFVSYTGGVPSTYLWDALTCVFVGSVVFRPGQFHAGGTLFGALLVGTLSTGMVFLDVNVEYQSLIKGLVLLAALALGSAARRTQFARAPQPL
jgi:ribose transport system permease protein